MPKGSMTLGDIARGDAMYYKGVNPGYSPEALEYFVQQYGSPGSAMSAILSARNGEPGADPRLTALSPEQRAQLDRYANFAMMKDLDRNANPVMKAINYLGGMANMVATEGFKAIPGSNKVASAAWRTLQGQDENSPQFFGGADVSKPSLANIMAAHYGYMR